MRAHCDALFLERLHSEDVRCVSCLAEFDDKEMPTIPLKFHQERAGCRMKHLGVKEEFRFLLGRPYLPQVCLGNRDLKVPNPIMVAKPKVFSPLVFTVIRKDRVEEENNVVTGQPRQVALGSLGSNQSPVYR